MKLFSRRSGAPPPVLRLLSRPGCHLCEELRTRTEPLVRAEGGSLSVVDVDSNPELYARWGDQIPVLLDAEGRLVAKARDPEAKIRRRLRPR